MPAPVRAYIEGSVYAPFSGIAMYAGSRPISGPSIETAMESSPDAVRARRRLEVGGLHAAVRTERRAHMERAGWEVGRLT